MNYAQCGRRILQTVVLTFLSMQSGIADTVVPFDVTFGFHWRDKGHWANAAQGLSTATDYLTACGSIGDGGLKNPLNDKTTKAQPTTWRNVSEDDLTEEWQFSGELFSVETRQYYSVRGDIAVTLFDSDGGEHTATIARAGAVTGGPGEIQSIVDVLYDTTDPGRPEYGGPPIVRIQATQAIVPPGGAAHNAGGYLILVARGTPSIRSIEACRLDKDQTDDDNWLTQENIAAGAQNTDVHKASIRVNVSPPIAGLSVTVEKDGGSGDESPAAFAQDTTVTDSDGRVYCAYTSSDKIENTAIKVTELAGDTIEVIADALVKQTWDIAGAYDFRYPEYYVLEEPDEVLFFPTLDESGGVGGIDAHDVQFYTPSATLYHYIYSYTLGYVFEDDVPVTYPDYTGIPLQGVTMDDLVEHGDVTENPSGVYGNMQTVHHVYDYNPDTMLEEGVIPMSYEIGVYDLTVVADGN